MQLSVSWRQDQKYARNILSTLPFSGVRSLIFAILFWSAASTHWKFSLLTFSGYGYLPMELFSNCLANLKGRFPVKFINYRFRFQVRLANNAYSLDDHSLFEYETHFTVMVSFQRNFFRISGCSTVLYWARVTTLFSLNIMM